MHTCNIHIPAQEGEATLMIKTSVVQGQVTCKIWGEIPHLFVFCSWTLMSFGSAQASTAPRRQHFTWYYSTGKLALR